MSVKKPSLATLLLIFHLLSAHAQSKVESGQVKKILVHNAVGGLGGGESADIEVVPEAGGWNSYLVRRTKYGPMLRKPDDIVEHQLITTLRPALIANLLTGIAVLKPAITQSTFGLTAPGLIAELKAGAKSPVTDAPDFSKLISQKRVDQITRKLVVDNVVMDDFEYSEVDVVTKHNDTIKLSTRILCPTKLPWTIGHHVTYNMAINNFVLAAIGKENVPNKFTLSIGSLKEAIYKYIDEQHANAPIADFKWKYYYPENLKLLAEHFKIVGSRFLQGNYYSCRLYTSTMPSVVLFESTLDMTNDKDVRMTIAYADLIDQYFKSNNFVLNYYKKQPNGHITLSYYTGKSPYPPLSNFNKKLPEFFKIDSTKTICFWAGTDDDTSYWVLFPNRQSLMTYHAVTTADGKAAPIFPAQNPDDNWYVKTNTWYLFDDEGKVLRQGLGW
jgi:hypothetical protein